MSPLPLSPDALAIPVPAKAGTGLKFEHIEQVIDDQPEMGWFEVHAENFFAIGGRSFELLQEIATTYPLSIHGTGLSLGSADGLNLDHLDRLADLNAHMHAGLVSEHLAWCHTCGSHFSDLLPLPYTAEAFAIVSDHVAQVQDRLGRQILVENPSLYVAFEASELPETDFLNALSERTGCGFILDVNNVYVSANNLGFDPAAYIRALDCSRVGEIHLAGHHVRDTEHGILLIDDHGGRVSDPVWSLCEIALELSGRIPVLIEWDNNVPTFEVLATEASRADAMLDRMFAKEASHVLAA